MLAGRASVVFAWLVGQHRPGGAGVPMGGVVSLVACEREGEICLGAGPGAALYVVANPYALAVRGNHPTNRDVGWSFFDGVVKVNLISLMTLGVGD